jgi:hypothetical protein
MYNGPIIRPDLVKINKGRRMKIRILMLWMKWRVVSTGCEVEVELVPAEYDLDYQSVYVFCRYICQNNWILITVVIF